MRVPCGRVDNAAANRYNISKYDYGRLNMKTPAFIIDEKRLRRNCALLGEVKRKAGCKILLAQKAYSAFMTYPVIAEYLDGTTASGLFEARLGKEKFGGETHVYNPAFKPDDFTELLGIADHFTFNSPAQVRKYAAAAKAAGKSTGLRVNPECSTQSGHAIYDPCAPGSRLGTTKTEFDESLLPLLDGLHFHTLCEQDSDALEITLNAFLDKFGQYLGGMKWVNFGGGHHITRSGYDIGRLVRCIRRVKEAYGCEVYLEPGEAVVLDAGTLVAEVLDVVRSGGVNVAVLDASAACHMPDVLEMPYRPPVVGAFAPAGACSAPDDLYDFAGSGYEKVSDAADPGVKPHTYRLAGATCLAGDVIGDWSFDAPLSPGDRIAFGDMALYTMVKTNTFNGTPLPGIYFRRSDGALECLREFGYDDFLSRL